MTFDTALSLVLNVEGDFSNHPDDTGGETRYGITKAVARRHGYEGPMRDLPLDLAKSIYRSDYWDACRCDELPWPMALFIFDHAVNAGVRAAITTVQQSLKVPADGAIGPVTIRAIQRADRDAQALYMADRALFYARLEKFSAFGRGWLKRLFLMAMT